MPTLTETEVRAFAHCVHPRCPGYQQEEVDAIRSEDSWTYAEQGGDLPGTERSFVRLRFADEKNTPCPHCGTARDLSADKRRQYANLSGYDPQGLLDVEPFDAAKQHEVRDSDKERIEAENAELRERLAKLEGFMLGKEGTE
jgi:phage terminase large subunit GpA-like protein